MKDIKTKILIAVICILAAISLKLFLELENYKDLEQRIPFYNPIFTEFAIQMEIKDIEEYENWIASIEFEEDKTVEAWRRDISLPEKYQKYTWEWCQMLDLDYNLVLALMYHESRFKLDVYSRTNDIGVMQVNENNKKWANELAKRKIDLYEPYDNILAGLLIYKHYQDYWIVQGITGTTLKQYALNSYNMGIGGFTRAGFPVTRAYGRNILETREELKQ